MTRDTEHDLEHPTGDSDKRLAELIDLARRHDAEALAVIGGPRPPTAVEDLRDMRDFGDYGYPVTAWRRGGAEIGHWPNGFPDIPPLSEAESEHMGLLLDDLRRLRAELLAERGGQVFPPAGEDLDALRAEAEGDAR